MHLFLKFNCFTLTAYFIVKCFLLQTVLRLSFFSGSFQIYYRVSDKKTAGLMDFPGTNFGPTLTAQADTPFFLMVKGIGIEGTFQRVESLIIALWVFSDLALLALLASSCAALAQAVFSFKERRHAAVPVAGLALAGAWLLFPDAFSLDRWMENVVWPGNLLLGFGLPLLLLLVKKLRGQV